MASKICLARLTGDAAALDEILRTIQQLPWDDFIPAQGDTVLPVGESLLLMGRIDALRQFVSARRRGVELLGSRPYLAGLVLLEAQLALQDGRRDTALQHLQRSLQWSRESRYVHGLRRGLELRLQLTNADEDREALRNVLQTIADSLPDHLREIFLASPRAAGLRE